MLSVISLSCIINVPVWHCTCIQPRKGQGEVDDIALVKQTSPFWATSTTSLPAVKRSQTSRSYIYPFRETRVIPLSFLISRSSGEIPCKAMQIVPKKVFPKGQDAA
jgi:hypothetical protein